MYAIFYAGKSLNLFPLEFIVYRTSIMLLLIVTLSFSNSSNGGFLCNFTTSVPMVKMGDDINRPLFGGDLALGSAVGTKVPIIVGAGFGFAGYGRNREEFYNSETDSTVKVTAQSIMINFNLFTRLQSRKGDFRPFVDLSIGTSRFSTATTVKAKIFGPDSLISECDIIQQWAGTVTLHAGLTWEILSLSVGWTMGTEVKYINVNDASGVIEDDTGKLSIDPYNTYVNMLSIAVGVAVFTWD